MRGDSNEIRSLSGDVVLEVDRVDGCVGKRVISCKGFLAVLTFIKCTDFFLSDVHEVSFLLCEV